MIINKSKFKFYYLIIGEFKIEPKSKEGIWFGRLWWVTLNLKGEMKGSAITEPIAKECVELFSRIAFNASSDEQNERN